MYKAKEEQKKLAYKGRKWLMAYLSRMTESALSEKRREQLISAACSLYRREMKEDSEFCRAVEAFCSQRRTAEEKNKFFDQMMRTFMQDNKIKKEYARKYPDEYSLDDPR